MWLGHNHGLGLRQNSDTLDSRCSCNWSPLQAQIPYLNEFKNSSISTLKFFVTSTSAQKSALGAPTQFPVWASRPPEALHQCGLALYQHLFTGFSGGVSESKACVVCAIRMCLYAHLIKFGLQELISVALPGGSSSTVISMTGA